MCKIVQELAAILRPHVLSLCIAAPAGVAANLFTCSSLPVNRLLLHVIGLLVCAHLVLVIQYAEELALATPVLVRRRVTRVPP